MKKILIHLEAEPKVSVFDQIVAYDAGVDNVIAYGGVSPDDVANLVYGAMFTRGSDSLRNTAIFIGGENVPVAEKLMKKAQKVFFGDVRVSVMMDPNGSNTTAAALVHKVAHGRSLAGKKALVLAGTGPVGMRAAILLAGEGCQVFLSSRSLERAQEARQYIQESHGVEVTPLKVDGKEDVQKILAEGINIVSCCGAPGIQMLDLATWSAAPALEIITDTNAVAPFGVEGIKVTDNGRELEGKLLYGPIAIGNLKMKIHRAAIRTLFESNNKVLDFAAIYEIAKETVL
jgi:hypothetical protein